MKELPQYIADKGMLRMNINLKDQVFELCPDCVQFLPEVVGNLPVVNRSRSLVGDRFELPTVCRSPP
ncbi:hypothetical protein ABZ897_52750 [Nonomuraea sp. NPDC046802]|uniref:hypothetical protein n=1 Tax=Nonomuraea sp. NPDC046802 TaxID=3154919 RepID=UPI0034042633